MESQLFSVAKIFTERILRIPDYQRGYAWGEKELTDFWNDVTQLENNQNHYTGVLTLETVPQAKVEEWREDLWIITHKNYYPYYVVDGQQRLTTIIILVQCITEAMGETEVLNYTPKVEIRKKFIFESKDGGISRSFLFGYEKDNPSSEFLRRRILGEELEHHALKEETIYTHNLERAKSFFSQKLGELTSEQLGDIYTRITQRLLFNVYTIDSNIDVHVAFEVMNNRGKPLSHLERLKNRLIYLATKLNVDDEEKVRLRSQVNEAWKAIYHFLGKNRNNPLDDDEFLLSHFFIYSPEDMIKASRLPNDNDMLLRLLRYRGFMSDIDYQSYLLDEKFTAKHVLDGSLNLENISHYVSDLKSSVEHWYFVLNPADSDFTSEEKLWLERLHRLSYAGFLRISRSRPHSSAAPLLMTLFRKEQNSSHRIEILRALERLMFMRLIISRRYMVEIELDSRFSIAGTAQELAQNRISVSKILQDIQTTVDLYLGHIPRALQRMAMQNEGFYGWEGLKYLLFEYELHLKEKTKTHRQKLDWDTFAEENEADYISIEHIYPQHARRSCWTTVFKNYSDKQKATLRHSIGNLVPLSKRKNSSLQNNCFHDKKGGDTGFSTGSYSEIEISKRPDWTATEIRDRAIKILDFMDKRWQLELGNRSKKLALLQLEFVDDET